MTDRVAADILNFPDKSILHLSEESMALDFATANAETLRYVADWKSWMRYDHGTWQPDRTIETFDSIRSIARARAKESLTDEKQSTFGRALRLASAKTVAAVETLARSDRRMAATTEQWDADPMRLGVPGGAIDLQTGEFCDARPQDYFTRTTSVSPSASASPVAWIEFLDFVTGGDADFQAFLQRVAGYCLTGSVREHAMFFIYGPGGNGKGVFINTLSAMLDSYARTAAMETFIDTGRNEHPTDLAMLRGSRLVTAQETQQGRRWAEAKIKQLTGGDKITARFMRQNYFTYPPQFKLVLSGNHKPSLRSVDQAIRRRFMLLPFEQTVSDADRDLDLQARLIAEDGPAILHWMIEGCLAWQREGLSPPPIVTNATNAYLSEEDAFGQWIEERCTCAPDEFGDVQGLYHDWGQWAETAREPIGTKKSFSQQLSKRGYTADRRQGRRGFAGISVMRGSRS